MTTVADALPVSPLPQPTATRWRPLRAGLQNIWQYDHTTRFVFHQGRLLLRGRNGAGKTKVVEVLLPFLLEGRLEPSRLDPFGTRSRKMHYNLLHADNRDLSINVGYVWLEFGRVDEAGEPHYCTVGAGLKARRSSDQVDSWFFVATDRRVDVDLDLVDPDVRPLSRPQLEEALGDDGRVYASGRDYRAAVNRELFGVTATQYEALVEAVLRLRQPHLSERLDPAEVGAVLADSLPPLDAEKVHEVAEGFERLEGHRRDLDDRRRALAAVEEFLGGYREYVTAVASVRARDLAVADRRVHSASERIATAETSHAEVTARAERLRTEGARVDGELAAAATRIHTLETSDAYQAVKDLETAEDEEQRAQRRAEAASARAQQDADAAEADRGRRDGAAREEQEHQEMLGARRRNADAAADAADLADAHAVLARQVSEATDPAGAGQLAAPRGTLNSVAGNREEAIGRVRRETAALTAAQRAESDAERRLDDADERLREATEATDAAERAVNEALDDHAAAVTAWAGDAPETAIGDDALESLLETDPRDAAQAARRLAVPARRRIEQALRDATLTAHGVDERHAATSAERDAVAAATHTPPPVPSWRTADRTDRAGAPLYLLAEFTDALDAGAQAGVEAALEASGLLDAWITPDGRLLDPATRDVVAVPAAQAHGRSLADVTRPTPRGGVPVEVVTAVLAGIGVVSGDGRVPDDARGSAPGPASGSAPAWVGTDGQFAIGPLRGAAHRDAVGYLGETARAAARARRLSELEALLEQLAAERAGAQQLVADLESRLGELEAELDRFPSAAPVLDARLAAAAAARELAAARSGHDEAGGRVSVARTATAEARSRRDTTAEEVGLAAHVDRLDELAEATTGWRLAVTELLAAAEGLRQALRRLADADRVYIAAVSRADAAAAAATDAAREAASCRERADTLRAMVGSTRDELLADLRDARDRQRTLTGEQEGIRRESQQVAEQVGATRSDLAAARDEHARLDGERAVTVEAFRGIATLGLLRYVLDAPLADDPATWSMTTALEHARAVRRRGVDVSDDPEAVRRLLESAENQIARRQQQLGRDLVAGIRLFGRKDHGVLVHDVQYQGRTYRLGELVDELRDDVAERDGRLQRDEQDLLETFLAGELHEHLRTRIRDAHELVDVMNDQLGRCPTPAGQRVRLQWSVGEDAPPGTHQAVDLLLRGAGLLTDDQRAQLRAFLHERLREAREGEAAASLNERIGGAFDYRRWYAFAVQVRDAGAAGWRRLTRQSHGTGSGGEKAVMLHLPLFAAIAAHYHASPAAPRLIVLDEVFAGIDRGTRGQLMGLLVTLDLDAVLTSHEEWGCYTELDGLSTYHLVRDPGIPGVLAEWFVWDGASRWDMEGAPA